MRNPSILALCGWLLGASAAHAQLLPSYGGERAGASALSFLKNDLHVGSVGMAGAHVALVGNPYSWNGNPAGASDVNERSLALSNGFVGGGVQHSLIALTLPSKDKTTSIGFVGNVLQTGAFEERTEFLPEGTGRMLYGTHASLGIGVAKRLSEQFSMGLVVKGIHEVVGDYRNTTAGVDIGFLYRTDVRGLQFAVALRNFGGSSALQGDFLATLFNRAPVATLNKNTLPTEFCMGINGIAWSKDKQVLRMGIQLNHPNDNAENYRIGLEYTANDRLVIRSGVALQVAGRTWPALGFSAKGRLGRQAIWIDYAATPTAFTGIASVVGMRLPLTLNP
jgi:hypothetical protein